MPIAEAALQIRAPAAAADDVCAGHSAVDPRIRAEGYANPGRCNGSGDAAVSLSNAVTVGYVTGDHATPATVRQARLRAGDAEAWTALYRECGADIHAYLARRTGWAALAEDLTSEVFTRAISSCETFVVDEQSGPRPWLFGIARNILLQHQRAASRPGPTFAWTDPPPDPQDQVVESLTLLEGVQEARAMMACLSDDEREAVELCVWAGLSAPEAALVADATPAAIRQRLTRARRNLRQMRGAAQQ